MIVRVEVMTPDGCRCFEDNRPNPGATFNAALKFYREKAEVRGWKLTRLAFWDDFEEHFEAVARHQWPELEKGEYDGR